MPKWAKILIGIILTIIIIITGVFIYRKSTFISKKEARTFLAQHINVIEEKLYFENVDLEWESSQYEVDFYYNNNEYEAKLDAKNGKVIYTDFPIETTNNDIDNSTTSDSTNIKEEEITLEEAKKITLNYINLNEENITLVKAQEEYEDGKKYYEIEWKDQTYEYEFEISKNGEIYHYDKDKIHD